MNLLLQIVAVCAGVLVATMTQAFDDDIYGESALPDFDAPRAEPEQDVVLPPFPVGDTLLPVPVDPKGGSFRYWIDPASISVGEDRIVRYTVVMRSVSGVENVIYEGVRCKGRQYRRYAYGSEGVLRPVMDSKWKFVRKIPRDRYRAVLLDRYFCPLPRSDGAEKIRRKLQRGGIRRSGDAFE